MHAYGVVRCVCVALCMCMVWGAHALHPSDVVSLCLFARLVPVPALCGPLGPATYSAPAPQQWHQCLLTSLSCRQSLPFPFQVSVLACFLPIMHGAIGRFHLVDPPLIYFLGVSVPVTLCCYVQPQPAHSHQVGMCGRATSLSLSALLPHRPLVRPRLRCVCYCLPLREFIMRCGVMQPMPSRLHWPRASCYAGPGTTTHSTCK